MIMKNPTSLEELMSKEFPDTEWVIDGLVPSEGITALSGAPASYKTWVALFAALAVASGELLFDQFPTRQTGVLIVDEENGERLLQQRLKKITRRHDLPVHFLSLRDFTLEPNKIGPVVQFCVTNDVGLVIFDSLVRIHGSDENDASKMSQVFKKLKKFNREGLSVLFTHHNRKQGSMRSNPSQDMRGSSDILAGVSSHIAVERKKEGHLVVNQTKLREAKEHAPFKLDISESEGNDLVFTYDGPANETRTKSSGVKEIIPEILERAGRSMYQQELVEALRHAEVDAGVRTIREVIKELVGEEALIQTRGDRNKMYYRVATQPPAGREVTSE